MNQTPAPTPHDHLTECLTFGTRAQKRMLRAYLRANDVTDADFVAGAYAPIDADDLTDLLATIRRCTRKPL